MNSIWLAFLTRLTSGRTTLTLFDWVRLRAHPPTIVLYQANGGPRILLAKLRQSRSPVDTLNAVACFHSLFFVCHTLGVTISAWQHRKNLFSQHVFRVPLALSVPSGGRWRWPFSDREKKHWQSQWHTFGAAEGCAKPLRSYISTVLFLPPNILALKPNAVGIGKQIGWQEYRGDKNRGGKNR